MRKADWHRLFIIFGIITTVGFLLFDNIASKFIFGIAGGGIFGWIFATKNLRRRE